MSNLPENIEEILKAYSLEKSFLSGSMISSGHINRTYALTLSSPNGEKKLLLQRINTSVFTNVEQLMTNIVNVTEFLRSRIALTGGDPSRETLRIYETIDGKSYYTDTAGSCWRIYNYVSNTISYDTIESPIIFYNAGVAFGRFQQLLADFPMDRLYETIADFHDTRKRYKSFLKAVDDDAAGRAESVKSEIAFVNSRGDRTGIFVDKIASGDLPIRVTHNDTKLNNVMFDINTKQAVCVVDLDTVMPGLSGYDFGDAIRFGANTAAEDEPDVSKVSLDLGLYRQYTMGYLSQCAGTLTEEEVRLLPMSVWMMTFECGMRFLTDYLNGDTYFSISYPEHNLVRCRSQFAMVLDIERKMKEMSEMTNKIYGEYAAILKR